jgi:hypothetical protein
MGRRPRCFKPTADDELPPLRSKTRRDDSAIAKRTIGRKPVVDIGDGRTTRLGAFGRPILARLIQRISAFGRLRGVVFAPAWPEGDAKSDEKCSGQNQKEYGLFEPRDGRYRKCHGEAEKADWQG